MNIQEWSTGSIKIPDVTPVEDDHIGYEVLDTEQLDKASEPKMDLKVEITLANLWGDDQQSKVCDCSQQSVEEEDLSLGARRRTISAGPQKSPVGINPQNDKPDNGPSTT